VWGDSAGEESRVGFRVRSGCISSRVHFKRSPSTPGSESGTRGSRIARIRSNRGGGAHNHLDAMNTGHPGSCVTCRE
jgi:hypothetical protein